LGSRSTLKALGINATVHGFRSTFADWAADNTAYPQEVREQCLAHAIPNKVKRRRLDQWATYCSKPCSATIWMRTARQSG
jgi:integrase